MQRDADIARDLVYDKMQIVDFTEGATTIMRLCFSRVEKNKN